MATPNLSIGQTSNGLRPSAAAHVKRLARNGGVYLRVSVSPRVERL